MFKWHNICISILVSTLKKLIKYNKKKIKFYSFTILNRNNFFHDIQFL
jgi:hypothetical protein